MRSRQRASIGTSSTSSGSACSPSSTSSVEPGGRHQRGALTRGLRDLSELLHLPAVIFVITAAFLFVRVVDDGRTNGARLGVYLAALLATQFSIALHNNWCDRHADAVTKPWRLLPRGALDPSLTLFTAISLFVLGLALAWMLGPGALLLVALGTSAGFAYNAWLKRTAWSWLPFALALPTLAVCSLLIAGRLDGIPFVLYAIGAPLVLAIHLADSIGDVEGDRQVGSRGLAVRLGRDRALLACWGGLLLGTVFAAVLRPFGIAPGPWLAASLALLALAVGASSRWIRPHRSLIFLSAVAVAVDYVGALAHPR